MFDEPVPESEELRKVKDLMGDQPRRESHRDPFFEEGTRGRRHGKPLPEEKEVRERGSRYRPPVVVDDLPETDFEPIEDEPKTCGRGRRGSRYDGGGGYRDREPLRDNIVQEEWSEVDAALQSQSSGRREKKTERRPKSDKQRRPERREEPVDREPLDNVSGGFVTTHGDVPSWDEAIGDIVMGNISKHRAHSSEHSGRSRR